MTLINFSVLGIHPNRYFSFTLLINQLAMYFGWTMKMMQKIAIFLDKITDELLRL